MLESAEAQDILKENVDLLNEAVDSVDWFGGVLKNFIRENILEFIGETKEDTLKNIRVFSEIATAQFLAETSARLGEQLAAVLETEEDAKKKS
ncbi:MAG: hypothetical protein QW835_00250 [Candidatus Hadarchaeum sp.]